MAAQPANYAEVSPARPGRSDFDISKAEVESVDLHRSAKPESHPTIPIGRHGHTTKVEAGLMSEPETV